MSDEESLLLRLRNRGEEVLTQLSGELMSNPRFVQAMQGAVRGKEKLEEAAARAIKTMNMPTRTEFKRALARIDALEKELAAVKKQAAAKPRRSGVRKAHASSSSRRKGARRS